MQTVLLVIHLIVALALIGAVLLQRSEGGALGIGSGGGGAGNLFSAGAWAMPYANHGHSGVCSLLLPSVLTLIAAAAAARGIAF